MATTSKHEPAKIKTGTHGAGQIERRQVKRQMERQAGQAQEDMPGNAAMDTETVCPNNDHCIR
jgi:hypothetical protein